MEGFLSALQEFSENVKSVLGLDFSVELRGQQEQAEKDDKEDKEEPDDNQEI